MRVLIHRQDCHPVCRIVREPHLEIDFANRTGERTAARYDEHASQAPGFCNRRERAVEMGPVGENAAADLHDHIDSHLHEVACVEA